MDETSDRMITIRRARQQDAGSLWSIQTQAIRAMGGTHYSTEQIEAWAGGTTPEPERYRECIEQGAVVAEDADGVVVGFARLIVDTGEVSAVYVHPSHTKCGIGKRLFEALEEEAQNAGLTELHVKASLNAVAFYERMGFIFEREDIHYRCGTAIPCAIMSKCLSP